jgi:cytochrome b subunit of formate dehydrogenase
MTRISRIGAAGMLRHLHPRYPCNPWFKMNACLSAIALAATVALSARGAIENSECMDCHADREMAGTNAAGVVVSLFVDAGAYKASVHGDASCTDCHADIAELPHAEALKPADCASCHDDVTKAYGMSLHGKALHTGIVEAASCGDCHGAPHGMLTSGNTNAPTYFANIPHTCGACHADAEKMSKFHLRKEAVVVSYDESVHGKALHRDGKHAAVCTDCHGAHALLSANDPASELFWQNIPKTCGKCHDKIAESFWGSVHGTAAKAGDRDAPVCVDCHGEHTIAAVKTEASSVSPAHIPETCGQCHGAERIATRYELSSSVLNTYMQSFHGLASQMGSVSAANCASCHGYHDILPSTDPRSAVHPDNLPTTCGACHRGIGTRLASGPMRIHEPPGPAQGKHPVVNMVSWVYIVLIVLVIGGMFVFNLLDYAAVLRAHMRRVKADPGAELRMTRVVRFQHASMILLFFLLAYTGFVHKYPESFWSTPFRVMPDGNFIRGMIHRVAGWAFVALFAFHFWLLIGTRRGRAYLPDLALRPHDATDAAKLLAHNVGLAVETPPPRRFNFAEKAEYWALMWGSVVMIVTGIMLIFTAAVLNLLPKVWLDVAQVVHYYEAVLATLAIVVWHFYWVILHPSEYPMNPAWLIGRRPRHGSHPHTPDAPEPPLDNTSNLG